MARTPQEGEFTYKYHKVADPGVPAWDRWMEDGDPSELISLLPGPADSWSAPGIVERGEEYLRIIRRMVARRDQCQRYDVARQIEQLAVETNPRTGKKYSQEEIAEKVSNDLNLTPGIYQVDVSRIRAWWAKGGKDWVSGSSHSVTTFTSKPPFIPIKGQSD